jgi:hypothetical protein
VVQEPDVKQDVERKKSEQKAPHDRPAQHGIGDADELRIKQQPPPGHLACKQSWQGGNHQPDFDRHDEREKSEPSRVADSAEWGEEGVAIGPPWLRILY